MFANLIFEDIFFSVLGDANPLVLELFLTQIELAISTLRHTTHEDIPCRHLLAEAKKSFVTRLVDVWQRILPSCAKQWRCFKLYIEKSTKMIRVLRGCLAKTILPKVLKLVPATSKPVKQAINRLLVASIRQSDDALRVQVLDFIKLNLAESPSTYQRI